MPFLSKNIDHILKLYPKIIDLSLDRCKRLLNDLGNPELSLPGVIHVAGTNGKGSTLAFCKALLEEEGYKVHRYTSPHLVDICERIELYGKPISLELFNETLERIISINKDQPITLFEVLTVAAFLLFKENPADYILLETGLGGRFDATNVIANPCVTAITTISYDHKEFLGETLKEIAFEKAGIIKPHVPLFTFGFHEPLVMEVFKEKTLLNHAPLNCIDEQYNGELGLKGSHQQWNAALALAIVNQGLKIKTPHQEQALLKTFWPGRMQCLSKDKRIWCDGAHNIEGIQALIKTLSSLENEKWRMIIHMKARKNALEMLNLFAPLASEFIFVASPLEGGEPFSFHEHLNFLQDLNIPFSFAHDIEEALSKSSKAPTIITGSLYFVGYVLNCFKDSPHAEVSSLF